MTFIDKPLRSRHCRLAEGRGHPPDNSSVERPAVHHTIPNGSSCLIPPLHFRDLSLVCKVTLSRRQINKLHLKLNAVWDRVRQTREHSTRNSNKIPSLPFHKNLYHEALTTVTKTQLFCNCVFYSSVPTTETLLQRLFSFLMPVCLPILNLSFPCHMSGCCRSTKTFPVPVFPISFPVAPLSHKILRFIVTASHLFILTSR